MKPDSLSPDIDSRIIMQGIHVSLTDAMRATIREKFGRLLSHNDRIIRINVNVHCDQKLGTGHHFTVTSQVEIPGPDIVASADGNDLYALLDALPGRLDRLLEQRHGKRKDKRNHPHGIELEANVPKVEDVPSDETE